MKRETRQPSYTEYTVSSPRPKPSKTPYTRGWPLPPFRFKSERHRRVWWALNDMSSRPDPDPEAIGWWSWGGSLILYFIDWLNALLGAEKPKHKTNAEQMATLSELFEGYEDG